MSKPSTDPTPDETQSDGQDPSQEEDHSDSLSGIFNLGSTSAESDSHSSPKQAAEGVAEKVEDADVEKPNPPPQAAVVYNPVKVNLEVLKAAINAGAESAGYREPIWIETSVEDPGEGMAKEAIERGADLVIAAGGDGTVRCVAQAMADTGVSLALLPSGTGNILARNLDLSLDNLEESVATAFTGEDRAVDAGVAELRRSDDSTERHLFVVMAGIGLDAQMIANTDDELKAKVGWLAYVSAITKSIRHGHQVRMRWSVDGGTRHDSHVNTLLVGNCGSLPGNVLLLPDAAVDDGELDFIALRPKGVWGWIQVWAKIFIENGILRRNEVGKKFAGPKNNVRALRYQKGKSIDISLREAQAFELDGDEFGEVAAFRASVSPGALRIRVPAKDTE